MMSRFSLSAKILVLACLNVLLLTAFFLVFARIKFRFNLQSFLLAPARATVASGSRLMEADLSQSPPSSWNAVLSQYEARYPARFFLFDQRLHQLAGRPVHLPAEVASAVRLDPFAEGRDVHDHDDPMHRPPPFPMDGGPEQEQRGLDDQARRPPRKPFQGRGRPDTLASFVHAGDPADYWVHVHFPIWQSGRGEPIHATLIWQIPSLWTERAFFDYRPWLFVAIALSASLAICWVPFLRYLAGTVRSIMTATGEIAEGNFAVQLPINRADELGELSRSIDHMAQRLAGHVHGQKRFLSDVAHELASPIARIQAGLGILEQRTEGIVADYVLGVREDVDHMSTLVNELLAFSKTRAVVRSGESAAIAIAPVIEAVLAREGARNYVIQEDLARLPAASAVPECLDRALANLIRNAIRYGGESMPIEIRGTVDHDSILLTIADYGPGLPPAELENVFRAFYRPEFARQRETGGTGLGLAIVRDCIEACRGTVHLRNRLPHGLEAVVRLRIASAEQALTSS